MVKKEYLTADDARDLSPGRILETHIKQMEEVIRKAAKAGGDEVRVPLDITRDWPTDSGGVPLIDVDPGKPFAEHFRKQGFTVKEFYEARQFVDTGIIISWSGG